MKQIIEQLIKLNAENPHRRNIQHLSPQEANQEYRTIRLDYGRATGKTSAILEMATDEDLIIVHNARERDRLLQQTEVAVIASSQFDQILRPDGKYRYVWVNEPTACMAGIRGLYALTADLFILLGA
jgi:hypothetical protein